MVNREIGSLVMLALVLVAAGGVMTVEAHEINSDYGGISEEDRTTHNNFPHPDEQLIIVQNNPDLVNILGLFTDYGSYDWAIRERGSDEYLTDDEASGTFVFNAGVVQFGSNPTAEGNPVNLDILTPNAQYTIDVATENGSLPDDILLSKNFTAGTGEIDYPDITRIDEITDNSVTVTIQGGPSNVSFYAQIKEGDSFTDIRVDDIDFTSYGQRNVTMTGLISGTDYQVFVQATGFPIDGEGHAQSSFTTSGNRPPELGVLPDTTINEGEPVTIAIPARDDEPVSALTFAITTDTPSGLDISGNLIVGTPDAPGIYLVNINVTDVEGLSDTGVINITVNDAPVLNPINITTDEGTEIAHQINVTDTDDDVHTFSTRDAPVGLRIQVDRIIWTPAEDQDGTHIFTVTASDDDGATDSETVTITVNEVNQPPRFDLLVTDVTALIGESFVLDPEGVDDDLPAQDLTFELVSAPSGVRVDRQTGLITWNYPETTDLGQRVVTIRVSDGVAEPVLLSLLVRVDNFATIIGQRSEATAHTIQIQKFSSDPIHAKLYRNLFDVPGSERIIEGEPGTVHVIRWTDLSQGVPYQYDIRTQSQSWGEGITGQFVPEQLAIGEGILTLAATTVQNQSVTINAAGLNPQHRLVAKVIPEQVLVGDTLVGIASRNRTHVTFTPQEDFIGVAIFRYQMSSFSHVSTGDVVITVLPSNIPPALGLPENLSINETEEYNLEISATDPDSPPENIRLSLIGAIRGATLHPENNTFSWTPAEDQGPGEYEIRIAASDGTNVAVETMRVTVNETNQDPVLDPIPDKTISAGQTIQFTIFARDLDIPANNLTYTSDEPDATIDSETGLFSWTPGREDISLKSIQIIVDDGRGGFDEERVNINVTDRLAFNSPPVALNDAITIDEDTSANIPVLANDSDFDGDTLSILNFTQPSFGTATSDGSRLQYVPDPNYFGSDSIAYGVSDGRGGFDEALVNITINSINDPPVIDDIPPVTVDEGQTVNVPINVHDPDGELADRIFAFPSTPPSGATLADGTFTWVTDEADGGQPPFRIPITVSDGIGNATAELVVTVLEVNENPEFVEDIPDKIIFAGDSITLDFRATDPDIPAQTLNYSIFEGPLNITAVIDDNGRFSWTPSSSYVGNNSITIQVSDDYIVPGVTRQTVNVEVQQAVPPPDTSDDNVVIPPDIVNGQQYGLDVLANDTVSDGTTVTEITPLQCVSEDGLCAEHVEAGRLGSIEISNDGLDVIYTYGPRIDDYDVEFNYTVTDLQDRSDTATVIIRQNSITDLAANDDVFFSDKENTIALDVLANDTITDRPKTNITGVTDIVLDGVANDDDYGTLIISVDDKIAYIPGANTINQPDDAELTFNYTISNGRQNVTGTAVIILNPDRSQPTVPPVFDIRPQTVDELTTLRYALPVDDADSPRSVLEFDIVSGPSTDAAIESGGVFVWTPTEVDGRPSDNVYNFTVSVSDGVNSDTGLLQVTVNEVNVPPFIQAPEDQIILTGVPFRLGIDVTDPDIPEQVISYSYVVIGEPIPQPIPQLTLNGTGVFEWLPTPQDEGTYQINVRASDGQAIDVKSFRITVNEPAGDFPAFFDILRPDEHDEETELRYTLPLRGGNTPIGELEINITEGQRGDARIEKNATHAEFVWTPTEADGAEEPISYEFTIRASDGDTLNIAVLVVNVTEVNKNPVIQDPGPQSVVVGAPFRLELEVTDDDLPEQTLEYDLINNVGAEIDDAGVITWTPAERHAGERILEVEVKDDFELDEGNRGSSKRDIVINVLRSIEAVDDAAETGIEYITILDVLANDTITPGTVITDVTQPTSPRGTTITQFGLNYGTVSHNGTHVTWTPDINTQASPFGIRINFTYTISSGTNSDVADVRLRVLEDYTPDSEGDIIVYISRYDPITVQDNAVTDGTTPVVIDVLANDRVNPDRPDADEQTLSITDITDITFYTGDETISDPARVGTISHNGTHATYTPGDLTQGLPDGSRLTSIYTVSDGTYSARAGITVTFVYPLDAIDDGATNNRQDPTVIDVLDNDIPQTGLTITDVTQPVGDPLTQGTVSHNGTHVTYTPGDFTRDVPDQTSVTFGYTAGLGLLRDSAAVTVTLSDIPFDAIDDGATNNRQDPTVIDVLANDIPQTGLTITDVTQPVGDPLTQGTASHNGTHVTYTPGAFTHTIPGQTSVIFEYTIERGLLIDNAVVTVTLSDITFDAIDDGATNNRQDPTVIDVLDNDIPQTGLTIIDVTQPVGDPATLGTVSHNGTHVTYTPGDLTRDVPDQTSVTFRYTAGLGLLRDSAAVTVTLSDIPFDAIDDDATNNRQDPTVIDVLANDTIVSGTVITKVTQPVGDPLTQGTVSHNGTHVTYTPGANAHTIPGQTSVTFRYTAGLGLLIDSAAVTVTLSDITFDAIDDGATNNRQDPTVIDVLDNDIPQTGLTIIDVTQPVGDPATLGTVSHNGTHVTYTPGANAHTIPGQTSVTFRYTAGLGLLRDSAAVTVTLSDIPFDAIDDDATNNRQDPTVIDVLANDTIVSGTVITKVTQPAGDPLTQGTVSHNGTHVTYTPGANAHTIPGQTSVTFRYTAGLGLLIDSAAVTVTLSDITFDPPVIEPSVIASDDTVTIRPNVTATIYVLTNDTPQNATVQNVTDPQNGDAFVAIAGSRSDLTPAEQGDRVAYTPNSGFEGVDRFEYTISSGNKTDTATVLVIVAEPPRAVDDIASTTMDTPVDIPVLDNDIGTVNVSLEIGTGPSNGRAAVTDGQQISYTPDTGYTGTDTFTYTISRGSESSTATVTVGVGIADDAAETLEDQAVIIDVLANDNLLGAVISAVSDPTHGSALHDGSSVTYTPNTDYIGTDTFTYTASAGGTSGTATVTVTVKPYAVDDTVTVDEDASVRIDVLANDNVDREPAQLADSRVSDPTHGTATVDGLHIVYTPDENYNGPDTFTYTLQTSESTGTATVTMTVEPVVDQLDFELPRPTRGSYIEIDAGRQYSFVANVTENADNLDFEFTLDAETAGFSDVFDVPEGANITKAGLFTWTPPQDSRGNVEFPVFLVPDGADVQHKPLRLAVNPIPTDDDRLVVVPPTRSYLLQVDEVFFSQPIRSVTYNDGSVALGLTYSLSDAPAGMTVDPDDGTISWTPDADDIGSYAFRLNVTDDRYQDYTQVFVNVVDQVIARDDQATSNKIDVLYIDAIANDAPADARITELNLEPLVELYPDRTIVRTINGTLTTITTFNIAHNGTHIVYQPSLEDRLIPDGAQITFGYTLSSQDGTMQDQANVTITLMADDRIEAVDDIASTAQNTPVNIDVLANDIYDIDNPPTPMLVDGPDNGAVQQVGVIFRYTPNPGYTGTDTFVYNITDADDNSDEATVTVEIDVPPMAVNDEATSNGVDVLHIHATANDEPANAFIAGLDLSVGSNTDFADFGVITHNGTHITYEPSPDDALIPDNTQVTFQYTLRVPGVTGQSEANVTITFESDTVSIDAVDDATPTAQNTPVEIDVLANDIYDREGPPVVPLITTHPEHGTVSLAGTNGVFRYTPETDYAGQDTFVYEISDFVSGESDTATVTVTVAGNEEPVLDAIPAHDFDELILGTLDVMAQDETRPGGDLTWSLQSEPAGMSITSTGPTTAQIRWTPTEAQGDDTPITVTVTVSDGQLEASQTVTVRAVEVNESPVFDSIVTDHSAAVGESFSLDATATDGDLPAQTITYEIASHDATGAAPTIDPATGTITWMPDTAETVSIDVRASDSHTTPGTTDITITVTVAENIVANNDEATSNGVDTLVIDVTANDELVGALVDDLTLTQLTGPSGLDVTTAANTHVIYRPSLQDRLIPNGTTVTYRYTLTLNVTGATPDVTSIETATANVTITFEFGPLEAVDDIAETAQNTPVEIDVLANDAYTGDSLPALAVVSTTENGMAVVSGSTITYTPSTGYAGTDTFVYNITDADDNSDEATVTVEVGVMPVAVDDEATSNGVDTLVIEVTANDTPTNAFIVVLDPGSLYTDFADFGAITHNDTHIIYEPSPADALIPDGTPITIQYILGSPGLPDQSTANVTITFESDTVSIDAVDDATQAAQNTPVEIDVLTNDIYDRDGPPVVPLITTHPEHGTVNLTDTNGVFRYTPETDYAGQDTFVYEISDLVSGQSDTATVTITVIPNEAPILEAIDNITVSEGEPVQIRPTATDTDDDTLTWSLGGDALPAAATFNTANGHLDWITTELDGGATYDIIITVSDGRGGSDSQQVTITVTELPNQPPVAPDVPHTVQEDSNATTITPAISDPDGTATITSITEPTLGTASHNTTTITYTPNPDTNGTDTITYTVTDDEGRTTDGVLTIAITPVNDQPVLTVPTIGPILEGVEFTTTLEATDIDNGTDELTFGAQNPPEGLTISGNQLSWTPAEAQGPGEYTFNITVTDGIDTASQEVTITVTEANQNPMFDSTIVTDQSITVGESFTLDVTATDADLPAQTVSYEITSHNATGAQPTIGSDTGTISWTPNTTETVSITVRASDDQTPAGTADITVTVTVLSELPSNTQPTAGDFGFSVAQSETFTVNLTEAGHISDPEQTADTLTVSLDATPAATQGQPDIQGVIFTYTANDDATGTDTLSYTVTDSGGLSDSGAITVTITSNQDPVLAPIDDITVGEGDPVQIRPTATDADDDTLTYTLTRGTLPAAATFDTATGNLDWTTTESDGGASHNITITVSDQDGSDSEDITITVRETNQNPVFDSIVTEQSATVGEPFALDVTATDADLPAQTVSYEITSHNATGAQPAIDQATGTITWTPDTAQTASITVRASDNFTTPGTADITITVTVSSAPSANTAPTASDISVTVTAGQSRLIDLTGQISDGQQDAGTLAISISQAPGQGTATVSDIVINYTARDDAAGTDTLEYTVTDQGSLTDTATITITITTTPEPNQNPTAQDITRTINEDDSTITITPQTSDPDGHTVTIQSVTGATIGTVSNTTTNILYTPNENQNGQETITYTVSDGQGGTATGMITITITPVNDAPVLEPIADITTNEGDTVRIRPGASDIDTGDTLTYTLDRGTLPAAATFDTTTGNLDWTTTESDGGTSHQINITVSDGNGGSDSEVVTITVRETNQNPVLDNINGISVQAGSTATFTATATDADTPRQTLTYRITGAPTGATINGQTGAFSWTPGATDVGPHTFTVTVSDGNGGSDSQDITVTVSEPGTTVNNPPALSQIGDRTVSEGQTLQIRPTATDIEDDTLTYALIRGTLPAAATFDTATGNLDWTPSESDGGTSHDITITVSDQGGSDSEDITITVRETNQNPILGNINNINVQAGSTATFTATATDADIPGQTLTYRITGAPAGATINGQTGAFSWTPAAADAGPHTFTVTVSDGNGGSDSQQVTITVTELPNQRPTAESLSRTISEDSGSLTITPTISDPDGTATISAVAGANRGTASTNATTITYTPNPNENGRDTIIYTVTDDDGATATGTITITITPVNDPPVLGTLAPQTVDEGQTLTYNIPASDVDDATSALTFTIADQPAGVSISGNRITWTPTDTQSGTHDIGVTVRDPAGLSDSGRLAITVNDEPATPNQSPTAQSLSRTIPEDSGPLTIAPTISDPDGTADITAISSANRGAASTTATTIIYTPNLNENGQDTMIYTVTDDDGATATGTITIIITPVNDLPVLGPLNDRNTNVQATLGFTVTATDIDGDALTFGLSGEPSGATINGQTGAFSWTPDAADIGPHTFTVTVSDGQGGSDSETITVTVFGQGVVTNDPPALSPIGDRTVSEGQTLQIRPTATDREDDTLTYALTRGTLPAAATFDTTTGNLDWTPSESDGGTSHDITITVLDQGGSDSEAITITVREANQDPSLAGVPPQTVTAGQRLNIPLTATDADLPPQTLSYSLVGSSLGATISGSTISWTPQASHVGDRFLTVAVQDSFVPPGSDQITIDIRVNAAGTQPPPTNTPPAAADFGATVTPGQTVSINLAQNGHISDSQQAAGTLTVEITSSGRGSVTVAGTTVSYQAGASDSGTDTVTYRVTDNGGLTDTGTITVTIQPAAPGNIPPTAPDVTQSIDEDTSTTITPAISDPDGGTVTITGAGQASRGTTSTTATTITYTPNANANGPDSFDYTATDDEGQTATGTVTINIRPINDPPVLGTLQSMTIPEDQTLTYDIPASDIDGDTLTFSAPGAPAGLSISGNRITWTPAEDQDGTHTFTITVRDPAGLTDSGSLTVTVTEVNENPMAPDITVGVIDEDSGPIVITPPTTDPDGDPITIIDVTDGDLGVTTHDDNTITYTPNPDASGPDSFIYTVTDDEGLQETGTISITITPVNDPPVMGPIQDRTIDEGQTLTIDLPVTDVDDTNLEYRITDGPSGASINDGVLVWTPEEDQDGVHTFTITVSDPAGLSDSGAVTVTVIETNQDPVLDPIGLQHIVAGSPLQFQATATDADIPANVLVFGATGLPAGASMTPDGAFDWTPDMTQLDDPTVTVTVSDGQGGSDSEDIVINVTPTDLRIRDIADRVIRAGEQLTFVVVADHSAGGPVYYGNDSISNYPSPDSNPEGTRLFINGTFVWTPTSDQLGDHVVEVIAVPEMPSPYNHASKYFVSVTVLPERLDGSRTEANYEWRKNPTFGKSFNTNELLVSCGYSMDGVCRDVTDYHVEYNRTVIETNSTHDFTLKAYGEQVLQLFQLGFGMQQVGAPLNTAEALIEVTVSPNYTRGSDGYDIVEVVYRNPNNVIDEDAQFAVYDARCAPDSDLLCVRLDIVGVTFREQMYYEPFAIFVMDTDLRSSTFYMNDGLLIQGESLNQAPTATQSAREANQADAIVLQLTRTDKLDNIWTDQLGNRWTQNEYGTWLLVYAVPKDIVTACTDENNRYCDVFKERIASHTSSMEDIRDELFGGIYTTPAYDDLSEAITILDMDGDSRTQFLEQAGMMWIRGGQ